MGQPKRNPNPKSWSLLPLPGVPCKAFPLDVKKHGRGVRLFSMTATDATYTEDNSLFVRVRYLIMKVHSTWFCTCPDFFFRRQWEGKPCKHIAGIKRFGLAKLKPGMTAMVPVE